MLFSPLKFSTVEFGSIRGQNSSCESHRRKVATLPIHLSCKYALLHLFTLMVSIRISKGKAAEVLGRSPLSLYFIQCPWWSKFLNFFALQFPQPKRKLVVSLSRNDIQNMWQQCSLAVVRQMTFAYCKVVPGACQLRVNQDYLVKQMQG